MKKILACFFVSVSFVLFLIILFNIAIMFQLAPRSERFRELQEAETLNEKISIYILNIDDMELFGDFLTFVLVPVSGILSGFIGALVARAKTFWIYISPFIILTLATLPTEPSRLFRNILFLVILFILTWGSGVLTCIALYSQKQTSSFNKK